MTLPDQEPEDSQQFSARSAEDVELLLMSEAKVPEPIEGRHPERLDEFELKSGHGKILRYQPGDTRIDPGTGNPVIPLVFIQGMYGDQKLPWTLEAFGEEDKRPVIGIQYAELQGSAKLTGVEGLDASVPEIDALQAEEIIEALAKLGVTQADLVAESRGAIRAVAAWALHPELFRHVILPQPAGQDGRGYVASHVDAARQAVHMAYKKVRGITEDIDPAAEALVGLKGPRGRRREQKSVARAQMNDVLASIPVTAEQSVTILAEASDKAFRVDNLRANIRDPSKIDLVETHWGRHGIGFNRGAVREVSELLRHKEAERAVGH